MLLSKYLIKNSKNLTDDFFGDVNRKPGMLKTLLPFFSALTPCHLVTSFDKMIRRASALPTETRSRRRRRIELNK